jgi:hypothetical protein
MPAVKVAGGCRNPQINRLFCKPICKPDAAKQHETREMEPTKRDGICLVLQGHRTRERRFEAGETQVVWLITQRSRVHPSPRYQGQRPFLEQRKGLLHVVCTWICTRAPDSSRTLTRSDLHQCGAAGPASAAGSALEGRPPHAGPQPKGARSRQLPRHAGQSYA